MSNNYPHSRQAHFKENIFIIIHVKKSTSYKLRTSVAFLWISKKQWSTEYTAFRLLLIHVFSEVVKGLSKNSR